MAIITEVKWGRVLTVDEENIVNTKLQEAVSAGKSDAILLEWIDRARRVWVDEESANNWIAFVKTFTPEPEIANVIVDYQL